ncbi:hypothetical protein HD806DRAFT_550367 [Xylariaceae sp. AK1471]|nr:hypothetical protein HD806DRAFT_550367 [Xylariaceae sp. AK1471]
MSSSNNEDNTSNSEDTAAAATVIERPRTARGEYSDNATIGSLRTDGNSSETSTTEEIAALSTDGGRFSGDASRNSKSGTGSGGYFTDADYYAWLGESRGSIGNSVGGGSGGHDKRSSATAKVSDVLPYGFSIAPPRKAP